MVLNIPLEIMSVIQTCDHCVILVYDAMSKNQLNQKLMLIVVAHDMFYINFCSLERFCSNCTLENEEKSVETFFITNTLLRG